jgi:hypothetical protein
MRSGPLQAVHLCCVQTHALLCQSYVLKRSANHHQTLQASTHAVRRALFSVCVSTVYSDTVILTALLHIQSVLHTG